jgi:hypothetical protein
VSLGLYGLSSPVTPSERLSRCVPFVVPSVRQISLWPSSAVLTKKR